jgi:hypothetical protein
MGQLGNSFSALYRPVNFRVSRRVVAVDSHVLCCSQKAENPITVETAG